MTLNVPGKIFIAGEYAALKGLPALTVAVNPSFSFQSQSTGALPFHPDSPAGLFNKNLKGQFLDPYNGIGGMGRSTAEFLAAASSTLDLKQNWNVWKAYRTLLATEHNTPSGVDLLTQLKGGYCVSETSKEKFENATWPFKNLDWVAVITGNKVKTHEHLAKPLSLDWQVVEKLNRQIIEALQAKDEVKFVAGLKTWREILLANQLEVPATTELVEFFMEIPGVVAAKGCGALGSDVVFVLFEKAHSQTLENCLPFWNEDQVIRSSQVCYEGVTLTEENENFSTL